MIQTHPTYGLYVDGRLVRKGQCKTGIARIEAPEGATLRTSSGGKGFAWHWRTKGEWQPLLLRK